MRVLHASLVERRLVLWGEQSAEAGEHGKVRRGRKQRGGIPISPYDVNPAHLASSLEVILQSSAAAPSETLTAWLPTNGGVPAASSPLIAPPQPPESDLQLQPWHVSGLPLTWEQAVLLLCACIGQDTLAPGIVIGNTLLFWAKATRFAGALTARQQFLPDIERTLKGYRAAWRPVFSTSASETLGQMARGMPSACRALSCDAQTPPSVSSSRLLSDFLARMCDTLVRAGTNATDTSPAVISTPSKARKPKETRFDSLHDQWLYALRSPDGKMTGDVDALSAFARQVQEWRRPLSIAYAAPFRLCFRLEEPVLEDEFEGSANASWYVRYFLQSVEDPSLLVPAEQAWFQKSQALSLWKRVGFEPREFLLAALGQAAKICPEVELSLKSSAPSGYELDTAGAQDFLLEKAWLLEQSDFVVHLPAWWTRKGSKQKMTARAIVRAPKMQANSGMSMETLVNFDWQVALGGELLTREELEALASQKVSLVRLRGKWVQLDAGEIEAALAFWKKQGDGKGKVRDLVRMALGAENAPGGLPVESVEAPGGIGEFLRQIQGHATPEELPAPQGFKGTLRPYQQRGFEWLHFLGKWGLGACLADDMGLGKTAQTLAFASRMQEEGRTQPILVICPTSVVGNWVREAQRFTPDLPVMVHHGTSRPKGDAFQEAVRGQAVVLSSFALLHRDLEILKEVAWGGIILDEAQNIKNPETKQSKAARALRADWRIALTGTPVENHVGDLWAILEFLNPGFLGSQTDFRRNFFIPIQAYRDPDAGERLKKLTQPFTLRRLKTDKTIIADLPEKNEMKVYCTLTGEQASLYEAVVKEITESLDEAEGIQRRGLILASLARLKQVCNHPAQFLKDNSAIPGRSGKLARLTEMLEEALSAGDKALVFTQFTEMGEIIRRHLQETFGKEVLFLHGGVPKTQRDRMVERFQSEEATPIFLLSLKAGGVGLNLTAASHVFHFDRWWNPAVENQATDRAFRIGQKKNVQVHKFLCAGTLEEKIDDMIESKREIAASIVGTGEDWLTEMSTAQLKELFSLRQDALAG